MAKKTPNTNFRLGLNRSELIAAAQQFGKSAKTAKRDSTKRLEQYLTNKFAGRGTKVPDFPEQHKKDVRTSMQEFGLQETLNVVAYKMGKITGKQDEKNYLRLTVARAFSAYTDAGITSKNIDELIARLPKGERSEIISGLRKHEGYYQQIFLDYADEVNNHK